MKVDIKRKGQDEVLFTFNNANFVNFNDEFITVRNNRGFIGNYNSSEFDFEVSEDD